MSQLREQQYWMRINLIHPQYFNYIDLNQKRYQAIYCQNCGKVLPVHEKRRC